MRQKRAKELGSLFSLKLLHNEIDTGHNYFCPACTHPGCSAGRYEPLVSVSTRKLSDRIEIKIKDNGNGIPHKIVDKIFHPFFTTKPTGQGTGFGFTLAYDIVKAHAGEIKVETKERGAASLQ